MIKRGLSVFDPPKDLVDASGVAPELSGGERVLWMGTPGRLSSFFCTNTVATPVLLVVAFIIQYRGNYVLTAPQYLTEEIIRTRWIVFGVTIFTAFAIQLLAVRLGAAFIYILTTKRMMVKGSDEVAR